MTVIWASSIGNPCSSTCRAPSPPISDQLRADFNELGTRGIRVPHDVSVCGFDNSIAAAFHDLTSYDFDLSSVAAALVNYLIAPHALVYCPGRNFASVGTVVVRYSALHARGTSGRSTKAVYGYVKVNVNEDEKHLR